MTTEPCNIEACEEASNKRQWQPISTEKLRSFYHTCFTRVRTCLLTRMKSSGHYDSPHHIQQALDDALLRFLDECAQRKQVDHPITWMCTAARNKLIDIWRAEQAREDRQVALDNDDEEAYNWLASLEDDGLSPEKAMANDGLGECLASAFAQLKQANEGYHDLMVMIAIDGMKPREIAAALDISPGAARERIRQARKQIQALMRADCPEYVSNE